ncbi:hypothetical protein ANDO1_4264 [plant metagenome]|uniref:Uncharacterized protein n=1 Tax=plant metagenome TaxID=1297885 RepID=A0A484PGZ8_9ZZZZ
MTRRPRYVASSFHGKAETWQSRNLLPSDPSRTLDCCWTSER